MNPVVVVSVVVCLFGGTMADDPVSVIFTSSNSSSGSAGGLLGCKPLLTSSEPGVRVRFQAVRSGGIEYSRKLVPSDRMTFSDVVATNSSSPNIFTCAKAATEKKWDAFSFVNGQCAGYKIGDGICSCTKGDFVLYLATDAIRRPSSARAFTATKGRLAAAPTPAGYIRKIIYPVLSMTDDSFSSTTATCEDVIANTSITPPPRLLHTANGRCYYTDAFSPSPCNSCDGIATDVLLKQDNIQEVHILSKCNWTIRAEVTTREESNANVYKPTLIYSHEGYGCIPYPDPANIDNCDITVVGGEGTVRMTVPFNLKNLQLDESYNGCTGDELFLYPGPIDGMPCIKKRTTTGPFTASGKYINIRFQRSPFFFNQDFVNKGFALAVLALAF